MVITVMAALLVVFATAVASMGGHAIDRTRAQTAADAAALAALDGGGSAAADLASRHGAVLTAWVVSGFEVTVTVRVGDSRATARATNEP